MKAPVVIFAFNRPKELKHLIESLLENEDPKNRDWFIFCDFPKKNHSDEGYKLVVEYLNNLKLPRVKITFQKKNKGLASSIIDGLNEIFNISDKAIILEDDLILSKNFLSFIDQGLDFYEKDRRILSICGYSHISPTEIKDDFYFGIRSSSWGWGTWKNRWEEIDWSVDAYKKIFYSPIQMMRFNRGGSDLALMLYNQMTLRIDSWAIRFSHHQFKKNLISIHPKISKVINDGYGNNATHTKSITSKRRVIIDNSDQRKFKFLPFVNVEKRILKLYRKPYSLKSRIQRKLKSFIS